MRYKHLILVYLFFMFSNISICQNITSRITILQGSSVNFVFDSYSDIENGITYEDFTEIRIYFNDTTDLGAPNPVSNGWELDVRANSATFEPDYGVTTLPLNTMQLRTYYYSTAYGPFDLGAADIEIAIWENLKPVINVVESIIISYDFGTVVGRKLDGYGSDFFSTDLIFTVKAKD
ncbi:MAG: hypothetical protein JEZ09_06465 [Salinivirgaceae bacterium]|nr:hypothetical protein [Salinivirgaceae bacterium]